VNSATQSKDPLYRLARSPLQGVFTISSSASAASIPQLQQVPLIAVEIFENHDGSVCLFARRLAKLHATSSHPAIVPPEVVAVQEKKDAPASLIADATLFLGRRRSG
jgi:hypothetical protein